ncbi:MAG TPA: hypothetical protein VLV50_13385 [Stellaceae bacterium]|nr:hypothetical protein [Stellaceae bacterium]
MGRSLAIPGCLVLLLASAAPGLACGFRDGPCPPTVSAPQPVYIPPIAGQQINTASAPIALPGGLPPAPDEHAAVPPAAPYDGTNGLTSIADLDRGVQSWAAIAPDEDFVKLPPHGLTFIGLTKPAARPRPLPPRTEVTVGLSLAMEVTPPITPEGVPGVDQPTLGSGNRALWFGTSSRE